MGGNTLDQPRPSSPAVQRPENQMWAEMAVPKRSHLHSRAVFHVLRATLKQVCKTGILIAGILACVRVCVCVCMCKCAHKRVWAPLPAVAAAASQETGGLGEFPTLPAPRQAAVCGGGSEPSGTGGWGGRPASSKMPAPHTPNTHVPLLWSHPRARMALPARGAINHSHLFLTVHVAGSPRSWCQQGWFLLSLPTVLPLRGSVCQSPLLVRTPVILD